MPPDGIGGGDLMLKAGATQIEPKKTAAASMYRMNIDKGNQSSPGPDMDTLGHINHTGHAAPGGWEFRRGRFVNVKGQWPLKSPGALKTKID